MNYPANFGPNPSTNDPVSTEHGQGASVDNPLTDEERAILEGESAEVQKEWAFIAYLHECGLAAQNQREKRAAYCAPPPPCDFESDE